MVLDRMRVYFSKEMFFSGETLKGTVEFKVSGEDARIKWLKVNFMGHVQIEYESITEVRQFFCRKKYYKVKWL